MQPSKFTPVIISTAVIAVISLFPVLNIINLLCCAGVILGGAAGTAYYRNQLSKTEGMIQYKDGVAIGVLSGIISALIVVIGTTLMTMIVRQNPIPEVFNIIDSQGFQIPPDVDKFLQKLSEEYTKNGFSITLTLISLAVDLISYPIFSAIGGLITVSIYTKKRNAAG